MKKDNARSGQRVYVGMMFMQGKEGKSPWKMASKQRSGGSEGAGHGVI